MTTHPSPERRIARSDYGTHFYDHEYARMLDTFCPSCGVKDSVWEETGGGDFYHGPNQVCMACGAKHCCIGQTSDAMPSVLSDLRSGTRKTAEDDARVSRGDYAGDALGYLGGWLR